MAGFSQAGGRVNENEDEIRKGHKWCFQNAGATNETEKFTLV